MAEQCEMHYPESRVNIIQDTVQSSYCTWYTDVFHERYRVRIMPVNLYLITYCYISSGIKTS